MGGTEPAEIRIEHSHDEEQVNGTTVVIEETHHYPPVGLNGEEIIETRVSIEIIRELSRKSHFRIITFSFSNFMPVM